jgi:hypothetical protein
MASQAHPIYFVKENLSIFCFSKTEIAADVSFRGTAQRPLTGGAGALISGLVVDFLDFARSPTMLPPNRRQRLAGWRLPIF